MLSKSPFVGFSFLWKIFLTTEATCCFFTFLSILEMNEKEERWDLCLLLSPLPPGPSKASTQGTDRSSISFWKRSCYWSSTLDILNSGDFNAGISSDLFSCHRPLVTIKCLKYKKKKKSHKIITLKITHVLYLYAFFKKIEREEDSVSKYTSEEKLLDFFSFFTVCIALVRTKKICHHVFFQYLKGSL